MECAFGKCARILREVLVEDDLSCASRDTLSHAGTCTFMASGRLLSPAGLNDRPCGLQAPLSTVFVRWLVHFPGNAGADCRLRASRVPVDGRSLHVYPRDWIVRGGYLG